MNNLLKKEKKIKGGFYNALFKGGANIAHNNDRTCQSIL